MKNLEFNSVLIGNRYPKGFCLPDYLRKNGKFVREKTLSEIVREEYGEIDEKGVKISVKDVTDEKFDGDYGYFFCGKAKHTALEFALEKGGKTAVFVADMFVPTKIRSYDFVVHVDFRKYLPTKYCPVEELMDGGIAVAHLYYKEISTDDGDFSTGIAPLFCDRSDKYSAGKLSLWAYAAKAALFVLCGTGEVEFGKKRVNIGVLAGSNAIVGGFKRNRWRVQAQSPVANYVRIYMFS